MLGKYTCHVQCWHVLVFTQAMNCVALYSHNAIVVHGCFVGSVQEARHKVSLAENTSHVDSDGDDDIPVKRRRRR